MMRANRLTGVWGASMMHRFAGTGAAQFPGCRWGSGWALVDSEGATGTR